MNVRNGIENLSQIGATQPASGPVGSKGAGTPPVESSSGNASVDKAQLSAVATQAAQTAQSASVSDVRLDKVASIQSALQAGTYRVPASDVAEKVIASLLVPEK